MGIDLTNKHLLMPPSTKHWLICTAIKLGKLPKATPDFAVYKALSIYLCPDGWMSDCLCQTPGRRC